MMADSAAIESAHKFALTMAEHASAIVAFATANGATYYGSSGDETEDTADLLADSAMAIEQVVFVSRDVFQRCEDTFTEASMALTPATSRHGITIDGDRYNSAHAAIAGWTGSVASAVRVFDDNPVVFLESNQFPIDVNRLRENLPALCEYFTEAGFALDSTEIKSLLGDAKLERIKALAALTTSAASPPAGKVPDADTFLAAELCREIGVSENSLRKYAAIAGVPRGKAGQTRRYTDAERISILNSIATDFPQQVVVDKCRKLLTETASKPQSHK